METGSKYSAQELKELMGQVDRVLLSLYDYPGATRENNFLSPISWYTQSLQRILDMIGSQRNELKGKLLAGLPFYGYETNYVTGARKAITKNE